MKPCRGIAPRPIIRLGDVAVQSGDDGFEAGATKGLDELGVRFRLADLVRVNGPEFIEARSDRSALARVSFFLLLRFYI